MAEHRTRLLPKAPSDKTVAPQPMKLPLPPPDATFMAPPAPPEKSPNPTIGGSHALLLPPLATVGGLEAELGSDPMIPLTPVSPATPNQSSPAKPKKLNPLLDLVDTEKQYIDQLSRIIRRVAAAWSRSNLPPKELDSMFRSVEGVYKANRALLLALKEIGTNPASPKALGDLLMRWIDDLEKPYTTYCDRYTSGFDTWSPILGNDKLPDILRSFSEENPPPPSSVSTLNPNDVPTWSLDSLFLLPKSRLKYYRKLYNRLLKSTTPGRSDHRLLQNALEKLDRLLGTLDMRADIQVGSTASAEVVTSPLATLATEEKVIDLRALSTGSQPVVTIKEPEPEPSTSTRGSGAEEPASSGSSSAHGSSTSSGKRQSRETESTSISPVSEKTVKLSVADLETRLSTDRALDVFTMQPMPVRLQMNLPSLTYTREIRSSVDVVMSFTPRATGVEIVHRHSHIFILTDLFLVCERMTPGERTAAGPDGPDMFLCYPPLAGKHLRVIETSVSDIDLQVTIMKKEMLNLRVDSKTTRDILITRIKECIAFSTSLSTSAKAVPPPMPPQPLYSKSPPIEPRVLSGEIIRPGSAPSLKSQHASLNGSLGQSSLHDPRLSGQSNDRRLESLAISGNGSLPNIRTTSPMPPIVPGSFMPGQIIPNLVTSPDSYSAPPNNSIGPGQIMPNLGGPSAPPTAGQLFRHPSDYSPHPNAPPPSSYSSPNNMPIRQSPSGGNQPPGPGQFMGPTQPHGPGQHMGPKMHNQFGAPLSRPPMGSNGYGQGPSGPYPPRSLSNGAASGPPTGLRQSPSSRSLGSQYEQNDRRRPGTAPMMPDVGHRLNGGRSSSYGSGVQQSGQTLGVPAARLRLNLPSVQMRTPSFYPSGSFEEPSPPGSPVEETPKHTGPTTSTISATMRCKVFLKQHHAQWKSLGAAKLKLYREMPTNIKQLVVEADDKNSSVLISTIVLADGVERVGKTGVAVELSDKGTRTGIIYMIQLRNEKATGGLYDCLLAGSDRAS